MKEKPLIINDHTKIETAYATSLRYLNEHETLQEKLTIYLKAYHEIGDLVPQTFDNMMSGHYFPYSESYYELENSYELCLQAFYSYAFTALRSVLELGILGVYFAVEDKEHKEVRPWIKSEKYTPKLSIMLNKIDNLEKFRLFDKRFELVKRIKETKDNLDAFIHTRGYRYSTTALTHANYNRFSDSSLTQYCDAMFSVISQIVIIMLLKYPIGMQPLPLSEKFGLNPPAGGYLEGYQIQVITSILKPEERDYLQRLSDKDPYVRKTVKHFESLPNLSDEEKQQQAEEFDRKHPKLFKE